MHSFVSHHAQPGPARRTSIWQLTLRDRMAPLLADYDWVVLDFPPNLGAMAICGLIAADKLIVTVPPKYLDW
jgi:cellulose biosynthesis protein BcsQ